jgi:hypothetical protein
METPKLKLVADAPANETPADRIRRLRAELKDAANGELEELDTAIEHLREIAQTIADGGEAFPPGVREICRILAEDVVAQAKSIDLILQRAGR